MGCRKLSYYEGGGSEEKSPLKIFRGLEEKNDSSIFCIDYYPFGGSFNSYQRSSTLPNKYLYNGKELLEETGWMDYGARMYMADLGRWCVIDPLGELYSKNSSYGYVRNNPTSHIDPSGMFDVYLNGKKVRGKKRKAVLNFYGISFGGGSNNSATTHEVEKGDTFYGLANRTYRGKFTVDDLRAWNSNVDENDLQIGQTINIASPKDVERESLVRYIAGEFAIKADLDPNDPVLLEVIRLYFGFDGFSFFDSKIKTNAPLKEGAGGILNLATPIIEYETKRIVEKQLAKRGVKELAKRAVPALAGGGVSIATSIIIEVLSGNEAGAGSSLYDVRDRAIRAKRGLDNYLGH